MGERPITDTFYAPFDLYERGKFDQVLEGLVNAHSQNEDPAISDSMTNKMFEDSKTGEIIIWSVDVKCVNYM